MSATKSTGTEITADVGAEGLDKGKGQQKRSNSDARDLQRKIAVLEEQIAIEKSEKEDALQRLEEVKRKSEYELQRLEKGYKDCDLEVQTLRDQCKRYIEKWKKAEDAKIELEKQVIELEAKINQLTGLLDSERKAKEDIRIRLEEEKRKSEYELQRLNRKIEEYEHEKTALILSHTEELGAHKEENRKDKERYTEKWRKAEDAEIELEKQVIELNRTIEEYKNEKVALHLNHKEELGVQKEENRKLKERLEEGKRKSEYEIQRLEEEKMKYEYELQRLEVKTNQLTGQLDAERKAKEDALIRLEKINKDFEHEVKSLKNQCNRLEEGKRKSEYEIQRLEKRYKDCELEVQTLRDQCKSKKEHDEKKMLPDKSYDSHGQPNKLVATGRAKRMVSEPSDAKAARDQNSISALGITQNKQLLEEEKKKSEYELQRLEAKTSQLAGQVDAERKANEDALIRLEAKTNQLTGQLDAKRKAKEEALIRLSSLETSSNPNIADLSDINRPTKLSDQFAELYDNEWTDAFDVLEKELNIELKEDETMEREIISYLRDILLNIHSMCNDTSSQRLKGIEEAFVKPFDNTTVHTEVFKMIKDALKSMAPYCLEGIRKVVLVHLEETYSGNPVAGCLQHHNVKRYIDKCTDVCWYMSVQDPQVFMDGNKSPNGMFDSNKHSEFTRKGRYEEYVVWPVLYLYKDGQMLSKGVAQGTNRENKKEITEH